MAEILLSLTIIGVVAAITLPSLMANINERTWNTQRKALYPRMSQAIAMMPQLGGYGTFIYDEENSSITADTAAEAFLTEGLSKVLKINNICDYQHLADCGIASSYTNLVGSAKSWSSALTLGEFNSMFTDKWVSSDGKNSNQNPQSYVNTKAAAFETQNGESVLLFYNPLCESKHEGFDYYYSQPKMCANFVYDFNGSKGPNQVGKDQGFITALYSADTIVIAPMPLAGEAGGEGAVFSNVEASAACVAQDADSRMPNIEELMAIFFNHEIVGTIYNKYYWSGSVVKSGENGTAWRMSFASGGAFAASRINEYRVRCVKR